MTDKPDTTGTPKPPARPGPPKATATPKAKPKPRVRKMANPPEPVKTEPKPKPKPKPKRKPQRTKLAGWEKGTVRSACFYVQDPHHQAVNVAASSLRVSKGIVVERALVDFLKTHPELEAIRPALKAILGDAWEENGQGDETGDTDDEG